MIRRLRKRLREIRYYSATRRESRWERAIFWSILLAIPLALLATWCTDQMVRRERSGQSHYGRLAYDLQSGAARASIVGADSAFDPLITERGEVARIVVIERSRTHGWPFVSTSAALPPRIDFYDDRNPVVEDYQPTPEERTAIIAALRDRDRTVAADRLEQGEAQAQRAGSVWLGHTIVYWFALVLLLPLLIRMTQFGSVVQRARRVAKEKELDRSGRCRACGYDMRGLEWNERCPECGALV